MNRYNASSIFGLGAFLVLTSAGMSQAVDQSNYLLRNASDLSALCSAQQDRAAIHMCEGYLVGVNQMHEAVGAALDLRVYCLPGDGSVTRDKAASEFAAWANAHPKVSSMSARDGLLKWARETYPCK